MLVDEVLGNVKTEVLDLEDSIEGLNDPVKQEVKDQRTDPFYCFTCKYPRSHILKYESLGEKKQINEVLRCDGCGTESRTKIQGNSDGFPYY